MRARAPVLVLGPLLGEGHAVLLPQHAHARADELLRRLRLLLEHGELGQVGRRRRARLELARGLGLRLGG